MKLHLCVICGRDNRYDYLRHTVSHALPVFDAIHIMDTGSTDRTSVLASLSPKINYFEWGRWALGWGDAYDCVRRDVPDGDWFTYLDSDELPSQYMLDHIRNSVERIEKEGYGQARIPNVLHVDGHRVGDPAPSLPRTPEEFKIRSCWTKPIICRNGPELLVENFGMHAEFRHNARPATFLPLYYCHHKHTAQIDAALSVCSFVLPESCDIPVDREENQALRRLADCFSITDPNRLIEVLQNAPPREFIDLVSRWRDSDLTVCRHWYEWYRRDFAVGGQALLLCPESCCQYDEVPFLEHTVEPGSVPRFLDDWRLEIEEGRYLLRSRKNHRTLQCNDSGAAVVSQVDGRTDVASIIYTFAERFPESSTQVRDGIFSLLEEFTSSGVMALRNPVSCLSDELSRAIYGVVEAETAFWSRHGPWSSGLLREEARKTGLIVASIRDGMARMQWNGHEEGRCRILGPYLQRIALDAPDIRGDFAISAGDQVHGNGEFPILGFSKRPGDIQAVMVPDIYFLSNYMDLRRIITEAASHLRWEDKLARAVWRGAPTGQANDERNWQDNMRIRLCRYSLARPLLVDARLNSLAQCTEGTVAMIKEAGLNGDTLPQQKQMLYKYIINVDGNSASWSGSFWKLLSNSLMIQLEADEPRDQIEGPLEGQRGGQYPGSPPGYAGYRQWYHPWLQRDRHFLACRLEDLESVILWAREHDSECREIAVQATEFVEEYLTDAAGYRYFVETLRALTRIQFDGQ